MPKRKSSPGDPGNGKLLVCTAAAVAGLFALWFFLPVGDWIAAFQSWIKALGPLGFLAFAVVYIVATIAMVPGAPMTIAAGVAFGLWGVPLIVLAATVGACLAFLIARYLARERVEAIVSRKKTFAAIDAAIEEDGWKVVGLFRLSPLVPFNLQNYLFGVTKVGFGGYALATLVGIVPGTILFVWLGTIGASAGAGGEGGTAKWVLLGLGLAATAAVTIVVSVKAKQKLREAGVK